MTYAFARHTHEGVAIGVIEDGAESFWYHGANHVATPENIMVFNSGEVHTGQAADERGVLNVMSTAGATILGVGYLLPLAYLTWSMRYGKIAGANPWPATGLEMADRFSATEREFPYQSPEVTSEPYDFANRADLGLETRVAPSLAPAHGDD